jgi:hypothetical protein
VYSGLVFEQQQNILLIGFLSVESEIAAGLVYDQRIVRKNTVYSTNIIIKNTEVQLDSILVAHSSPGKRQPMPFEGNLKKRERRKGGNMKEKKSLRKTRRKK